MDDAHTTPPGSSRLTGTADVMLDRLLHADKARRFHIAVLYGLCVALVIALGLTLWNGKQVSDLVRQNQQIVREVKHGAITNCESGNRARAANRAIWDEFLNIAVNNPNVPKARAEITAAIVALHLPADVQQGMLVIVDHTFTQSKGNLEIVKELEQYIAAHEQPVNCPVVYSRALGLG